MIMTPKIILLVGFQASTKSSVATEITSHVSNATILSRDKEGGTIESLVPKADKLIQDGKVVIVDNTNLTKKTRKLFIDLAKKYNVNIDAQYCKTTIEDCQIRHLRRMYDKFGQIFQTGTSPLHKKDPHCFGSVVLFKSRKDLELPSKEEGFRHVIMRYVTPILWDETRFVNKALFLDIDGTIRHTEHLPYKYPTHLDEVMLLHSAEKMREKLEMYRANRYYLIGVSNQSGISKGIVTEEAVNAMFEKTRNLLGYSEKEFPIIYCPHRLAPITCFCRKPQVGMPLEFIMKLNLNPLNCIMVGDMKTDAEMANRLSMKYYDVKDFW